MFNISNFGKNNTPEWASKIGNFCLIAGCIGTVIVSAPIALPTIVVTAGGYLVTIGIIGKTISKCFGENQSEDTNDSEN